MTLTRNGYTKCLETLTSLQMIIQLLPIDHLCHCSVASPCSAGRTIQITRRTILQDAVKYQSHKLNTHDDCNPLRAPPPAGRRVLLTGTGSADDVWHEFFGVSSAAVCSTVDLKYLLLHGRPLVSQQGNDPPQANYVGCAQAAAGESTPFRRICNAAFAVGMRNCRAFY